MRHGKEMYLLINILMITSALSIEVFNKFTPEGATAGKAVVYLDLPLKLISSVGDSCPVCSLPMDCEDILQNGNKLSGVYEVWPRSRILTGPIHVYCDMETDEGGWTIIQRRGNYSRSKNYFTRGWEAYKTGFGDIKEDFWLGNNNIFALSNQKAYSVRFDLQDFEGNRRFALYDAFWIDDETQKFTIHISGYSGDAGDSIIQKHNGAKFSTDDNDNDDREYNCAALYKGGWWYAGCHDSNLNGLYHDGKHESYADGVNWRSWKDYHESLKTTEIKIRKKKFL